MLIDEERQAAAERAFPPPVGETLVALAKRVAAMREHAAAAHRLAEGKRSRKGRFPRSRVTKTPCSPAEAHCGP